MIFLKQQYIVGSLFEEMLKFVLSQTDLVEEIWNSSSFSNSKSWPTFEWFCGTRFQRSLYATGGLARATLFAPK